jgi:hypothetical protein
MYKKITHTIVEEHFDHPIASQIKKSMSRSKIPNNEILSENKFRSDANAYFSSFQIKLKAMIDSVTGTEESLILPFEDLFKNCQIDDLGNMTKSIYASEFGERINEAMRMLAITTLLSVQNIKTGKDNTFTSGRFAYISNAMAQNLSNFNNQWNYQVVNGLFASIGTEIIKDANAETLAIQKLGYNITTFEKAFIDGIINQHPERFSKSTTSSNHTNKDIM